jgi:hypothetical protein
MNQYPVMPETGRRNGKGCLSEMLLVTFASSITGLTMLQSNHRAILEIKFAFQIYVFEEGKMLVHVFAS